eukprot:1112252-Alexandrium_andersonii.AAC.1
MLHQTLLSSEKSLQTSQGLATMARTRGSGASSPAVQHLFLICCRSRRRRACGKIARAVAAPAAAPSR